MKSKINKLIDNFYQNHLKFPLKKEVGLSFQSQINNFTTIYLPAL